MSRSAHPTVEAPRPTAAAGQGQAADRSGGVTLAPPGRDALFDLSGIDLTRRMLSRQDLERLNPHRGDMALLDWIVWHAPDFTRGIGLKHARADEFWVKGHFPGRPMYPGVLMIESGAQLAVFLYNARLPEPRVAAFTRIENAVFRAPVLPGDDLLILCQEIKWTRRGFTCDVQGFVGEKIAFEARVQGLAI